MHYANLVVVEKLEKLETGIEHAMGPSEEHGGFWDWYQIGGRWTGALDGYEPETDPANIETCTFCGGAGTRTDMVVKEGCNACEGKGKRAVRPTQFQEHPGDILPIEMLTQEQLDKFFRVVIGPGSVFGGQDYLPWKPIEEMFPRREKPPLDWLKKEYAGRLVVVVDNHS